MKFVACLLIIPLLPVSSAAANEPARKDPNLAGLLSVLQSGAGQLYNGEYTKGWLMFGLDIVCFAWVRTVLDDDVKFRGKRIDIDDNNNQVWLPLGVLIANRLLSPIDAYSSAERINKQAGMMSCLKLSPIAGRKGVKFSFSF